MIRRTRRCCISICRSAWELEPWRWLSSQALRQTELGRTMHPGGSVAVGGWNRSERGLHARSASNGGARGRRPPRATTGAECATCRARAGSIPHQVRPRPDASAQSLDHHRHPRPPPTHIVSSRPTCFVERGSAVQQRAQDPRAGHPNGRPSAIAPPFGVELVRERVQPSSRADGITWAANASFHLDQVDVVQSSSPVRSSACREASTVPAP